MENILLALILDLLIGDPYFLPHPVKLMGHIISFEERIIRRISTDKKFLKIAGLIITIINPLSILILSNFILTHTQSLLFNIIEVYFIYTCISARMLHYEAFKVKEALDSGISEARERLKYIVGRDTTELTEEEIISATVETVAENTSDGVIAPLFYIFFLGVPFGFAYKFINTMDSMIGYKNEKYEDLGFFPAKIDDVVNYLPARITAFIMAVSMIFKFNTKQSINTILRDHNKHLSPNAGYPEAAVAGLLGIRLGGGHNYFGKYVHKPYIGDKIRDISPKDINNSVFIMYGTTLLFFIIVAIFYVII